MRLLFKTRVHVSDLLTEPVECGRPKDTAEEEVEFPLHWTNIEVVPVFAVCVAFNYMVDRAFYDEFEDDVVAVGEDCCSYAAHDECTEELEVTCFFDQFWDSDCKFTQFLNANREGKNTNVSKPYFILDFCNMTYSIAFTFQLSQLFFSSCSSHLCRG